MRVDKPSGVLHGWWTDTAPEPARAPPSLPEEEGKMVFPSISDVAFGRTAPCICVRDIQAAHNFYSRILGFRKVFENGDPVGFMVLKKDQAEIHLSRKPDHHASTANVMHMFVSDAAALYSICEAEGVRIIKRLMDKEYGQRAFVFADPDGNRVDIGERIR
ncbi:VOC family protein [Sphingomonas sp. CLY1604]|uniref:VOC family protein n=1 Tax=Sphingomonas sp. CLY1604 TaxID=3457786 RepID=UPI003FD8B086